MSPDPKGNGAAKSSRDPSPGILEPELFELFEGRALDRGSFREKISARISERAAAAPGNGAAEGTEDATANTAGNIHDEEERSESTPWRRAAALLPAHTAGTKLIPTAFAWPALLLVAAFGGFFLGKRSLQKSLTLHGPLAPDASKTRVQSALTSTSWITQLLFVGALAFGGANATDAVLLVLLLGTVGFVWVVRMSALAGRVTRHDVAEQAALFLDAIFWGGAAWFLTALGGASLAQFRSGLVIIPLAMAILAIHVVMGNRTRAWTTVTWFTLVMLFWNPLGFTNSSPASLREQVRGYDLNVKDLGRWTEAAEIRSALADIGEQRADMYMDGLLKRQIVAAVRDPKGVHPTVWMSADAMGLMGPNEWKPLAEHETYRLEQLKLHVKRTIAGGEPSGISPTTYQQFGVPMLLATEDLDAASLDALAQMALANWPETGDHGALEQAVACIRLLDRLDRPDLVEDLRQEARELVSDHWIGDSRFFSGDKVGGFSPDPNTFHTSFDGDTLAGVILMARFGVPENIDLFLLRGYLRHESHTLGLLPGRFDPRAYLRALERAALLRLNRQIGLPERTWFERVLDMRMMIVVLLIIGLCLTAIRIAPPDPLTSPGGAQP